jgi:hypothetical protein
MNPAQLLTRNHYRIQVIDRRRHETAGELVFFRLLVNDTPLTDEVVLEAAIFDDLTRDLGMRPTSAEGDEWESTPMSATTYRGEIP